MSDQIITEEWRDVAGYHGLYKISNIGRLYVSSRFVRTNGTRNNLTFRMIKSFISNNHVGKSGYVVKVLSLNGTMKNAYLHRLMATAFIPNPDSLPEINHIDGVKSNNDLCNLEWCTHKHNMRHAFDNGLVPRKKNLKGENSMSAKLTDIQVIEIKRRLHVGERVKLIAIDYPVGESAISEIKAGRSWSHL